MVKTRGGCKVQVRRSSRLRVLKLPKNTSSEPIDLLNSSSESEKEEKMVYTPQNVDQNIFKKKFQRSKNRHKITARRPPLISEDEESCEEEYSIKDLMQNIIEQEVGTGNYDQEVPTGEEELEKATEKVSTGKVPTREETLEDILFPDEEQDIQDEEMINKANEKRKEAHDEEIEHDEDADMEYDNQDNFEVKIKIRKWKRKGANLEDILKKRRAYCIKPIIRKTTYFEKKELEGAKHINKAKELVKIRNSPRLLSEMIYYLSEDQRQWVKKAGFESVLDFDLEMLPAKLAYNVLQIFDHNSVTLELKNGRIYITEEDVFDVLGLPHGREPIRLGPPDSYKERINEWLSQFSTEKEQDQITTGKLVQKIKGGGVTENFKLNFLLVLSNVLIGSSTQSYINRQLLRFDDDIDKCCNYNWAQYLINQLVAATEIWNHTTSVFYTSSLVFLTLFYVDRVRYRGIKLVERHFPSYRGWTENILKERQAMEVLNGFFGIGMILPPLREVLSQDTQPIESPKKVCQVQNQSDVLNNNKDFQDWDASPNEPDGGWDNWINKQNISEGFDSWTKKQTAEGFDSWTKKQTAEKEKERMKNINNIEKDYDSKRNDHQENLQEEQNSENDDIEEKDLLEILRVRARDIVAAKLEFDKDLLKAQQKYPQNEDLLDISNVFSEVFNDKHKDDGSKSQKKNTLDAEATKNVMDDFDLQPEHVEHIDLIQYLHSKQAIIDMPDLFQKDDNEDESVPSFSLGIDNDDIISQVCDDINKEHDKTNEEKKKESFVTPKAATREKSTRQIKLGPYSRSPFVERVIDVAAKYTNQDIALWRYMYQNRDPLEEVFIWNGVKCIREHMQTLKRNTCLYYSVIDTWATILNNGENYKADESPLRLFCNIGGLTWSLDANKPVHQTYPFFQQNMDDMLTRYPTRRLQDVDMVFFPVNKYEHFYLISYNLKSLAIEIIDNMEREDNGLKYYGRIPTILHSHFVKYLKEKSIHNLAKSIQKLKPSVLSMQWQTKQNSTDCGIFLMRHMETYKGDARTWESKLKTEASGSQSHQIIRLRTKYNNAILSSNLNEKRSEILKEAKQLYNKDAEQKLFELVHEASARKGENNLLSNSTTKGVFVKQKTVTFAAHLSTTFEEVHMED